MQHLLYAFYRINKMLSPCCIKFIFVFIVFIVQRMCISHHHHHHHHNKDKKTKDHLKDLSKQSKLFSNPTLHHPRSYQQMMNQQQQRSRRSINKYRSARSGFWTLFEQCVYNARWDKLKMTTSSELAAVSVPRGTIICAKD